MPTILQLVVPIMALAAVLSGCSKQVTVNGTFEEVWERTQLAMQSARFGTLNDGMGYERLESDRVNGTLKYVWTDRGFVDARVVTLRIAPAAEALGAACPALDRTIHIDATAWGFFGWAQITDGAAAQQAYDALMAEFAREPREMASIGMDPP